MIKKSLRVVAAVIEEQGRILICRRKNRDGSAGRWEFPGGKLEQGETERECLARELMEELGVAVEPSMLLARVEHEYDTFSVKLAFYRARITGGTMTLNVHADAKWAAGSSLPEYDFLPADTAFVRGLAQGDFGEQAMKNDFETHIDKLESGSVKWNEMKKANPAVGKGIVPLSVADMEFKTAPEIVQGLKAYLDSMNVGYTQATDSYYEAVSMWMARRHGWKIEKEWIVTTPGIVFALGLSVQTFTQPGDGVIIMTPVYYPFYMVVEQSGRKLQKNALINNDGYYEIDFDDLERKARDENTKMLILCSPHNPVGRVWTKEELLRVGEICEQNGVLAVVDEIHNDLIMPGFTHTVFPNVREGFADNAVICTAPSKTFNLAGMQVSNIVIKNKELRRKFARAKYGCGMIELNALGYQACEIAYRSCEGWLEELLSVLDENRRFVEDLIAQRLPKIKVSRLEGTYLMWLDLREYGIDHRELERIMTQEAQLFFDEGYIFGEDGKGFERVNIACPKAVLEQAMQRLEIALQNK